MTPHIEDGNEHLLAYVASLVRGNANPATLPDGSVRMADGLPLTDPYLALATFARRHDGGCIQCPYTYAGYRQDDLVLPAVTGMGLDADAFWLLVLFCYDFTRSLEFVVRTPDDTVMAEVQRFLDLQPAPGDPAVQLTLKTSQGRAKTLSSATAWLMLELVKRGLEGVDTQRLRSIIATDTAHLNPKRDPGTLQVAYFASLLRRFLDRTTPTAPKGKPGNRGMADKQVLCARLVYRTGLNLNPELLYGDSPDTLKGYLKSYKDKYVGIRSSVYPTIGVKY